MHTTILWHDPSALGSEHCTFRSVESGFEIHGIVLTTHDGRPLHVEYTIALDADWCTREVRIHQAVAGGEAQTLQLTADQHGGWWCDGERLPTVQGCTDIDLGISPSTNTLPIRRLNLQPGDAADASATWIRFPDLTIERLDQRYERLSDTTYRYGSASGFTALLHVDDDGLVLEYEGAWRAVARN